MRTVSLILIATPLSLIGIAYFAYPLVLSLLSHFRPRPGPPSKPMEWPTVSVTVPSYNEAATIAQTLERILQLDYPADKRQILVISDASTDGTDDIVRHYANRG